MKNEIREYKYIFNGYILSKSVLADLQAYSNQDVIMLKKRDNQR